MKRNRSFINKLKRNGSSIEPCRTTAFTSYKLLNLLFIWTLCLLFFRQLHMKLNACFKKPYDFSFASKRSRFMVSKAFERSVNMADIFSSLSKAFFHFYNLKNVVCHVKPVIHFKIFFSIKLLIYLQITHSKTFDMRGNKLTGLWFSFCKGLRFLYTGVTSDCFNSSGKVDSFREWLIVFVRYFKWTSIVCFKILAGMAWYLEDIFEFNFKTTFLTSSMENILKLKSSFARISL